MRHGIGLIMAIFAAGFVLSTLTAHSQSFVPAIRPGGDQPLFNSHQMNQPPPMDPKYNLSADRLEEIRQLYLEAKKQLEEKNGGKAPDSKLVDGLP
jgi:hypothetical protein